MTDGVPSTRLVRIVAIALLVSAVLGLYLLAAKPTFPHERERTAALPRPSPAGPAGARPVPSATPAPVRTVPDPTPAGTPPSARRHTIQPGDTLLIIAEQYDTTVDAIRAANPGLSETALRVGAEIVIPQSR